MHTKTTFNNFNNFNIYNKATIKVVLVGITWSET
jgi:hypothetical protein